MRSNESLHGLYTCLNGFCIKFFLTANKTAAKQNISYLKLARKSEHSVIGKNEIKKETTERAPPLAVGGRAGPRRGCRRLGRCHRGAAAARGSVTASGRDDGSKAFTRISFAASASASRGGGSPPSRRDGASGAGAARRGGAGAQPVSVLPAGCGSPAPPAPLLVCLFICLCRAAPPRADLHRAARRVLIETLPRVFRRSGRGEEAPIKTKISCFNGLLN